MEHQPFASAFVPFVRIPFDQRAALAIRWIVERERETGLTARLILADEIDTARLILADEDEIDYLEPIRSFKSSRPWSSLRSRKALGIA